MKENIRGKKTELLRNDKKNFCSGVDITFPWDHIKIQITSI